MSGNQSYVDPSKLGKADCYEMARFWGVSVQEVVKRMEGWAFADYDQYDGEMLFHIPDNDLRIQVDQARFDGRLVNEEKDPPTQEELQWWFLSHGITFGDQDYSDL